MLRHPDYTRNRIHQLRDRFKGKIWLRKKAADRVLVSPKVERIPYEEAMRLKFRPVRLGEQFGPLFATYWFKVTATVPREWRGQRVDLLWSTHGECTLWIDGKSVEGLNDANNYGRVDATLLDKARGGERLEFFLEMACNDAFGHHGQQWPEHRSPIFLDRADIAAFDPGAWDIYHDLKVLTELEAEQSDRRGLDADLDKTWGGTLLFELNRFANECDEDDPTTWAKAARVLKDLLKTGNADVVHQLSAIGHAHIDTAWLWPLAETWRKCERTFSTQTRYMKMYPEYKFSCSQAYQYAIIKKRNPDLYKRIQKAYSNGQWVPVGGTWIEPDCNIPSGEALIRQFLLGQRFFEREFGKRCNEFWNPDVFGYNGQLPQIMRHCGVARFLTQKLSWNAFNKPMHQTFHWEGIDGSQVLAHFPPADTYNAVCTVGELRKHARTYKDNDRTREGIYLFGFGDGGGGPTRTMLEAMRRVKDLQGVPQCNIRTSDEFFERLEADAKDTPVVVGELYFELHRGTYTTQARTKRGNRKSEFLLHDIEFAAAVASRLGRHRYPKRDLQELWEIVLLNQFHDILPGSSIRPVYEDAEAHYTEVEARGVPLRDAAVQALAGKVVRNGNVAFTPVNTTPFPRAEVAETPTGKLVFAEVGSYGVGQTIKTSQSDVVTVKEGGKRVVLENGQLKATLSADGRLLSLVHKPTGRESLAEPGNVLEIATDRPTNWEAWDVDPWINETLRACDIAESCTITRSNPLRVEVTFTRTVGEASSLQQVVRLDAGASRLEFHTEVDWQEHHKMLKVAFPVDVRAMNATYEMQFGAVERPTHANNSVALAQYEVPGHKWADLSETGFGVALLTESKYGFASFGNTMRISLLRATKSPDPVADLGRQSFSYAVYPHAGRWQEGGVVAEGYRFNVPLQWSTGQAEPTSYFSVDNPNLVLDTVKQAEDERDALVMRFYECHGARGTAKVRINVSTDEAVYCNGLEDDGEAASLRNGVLTLPFTPYQVISVKLR